MLALFLENSRQRQKHLQKQTKEMTSINVVIYVSLHTNLQIFNALSFADGTLQIFQTTKYHN